MSPAKIPTEEFAEALKQTDQPVLDANQLGDAVGVTATTVRNRRHDLNNHQNIGEMEVGNTTVWWYKPDSVQTESSTGFSRECGADEALGPQINESGQEDLEYRGVDQKSARSGNADRDTNKSRMEPSSIPRGNLVEFLATRRIALLGAFTMLLSVVPPLVLFQYGGVFAQIGMLFSLILAVLGIATVYISVIANLAIATWAGGLSYSLGNLGDFVRGKINE